MSVVLPYQFEPEKKHIKTNSSDDEWEDVNSSDDNEVDEVELEQHLSTLNRTLADKSVWCKCEECEAMPVNRECLCCHEIDEIKYKKISNGKSFFNLNILLFIFCYFSVIYEVY